MIEIDEKLFLETANRVDDMSDGLGEATDKRGRESVYKAIGDTVDRYIANPVLEQAKARGRRHTGDRVETIHPVSGDWQADVYTAGLRTTNEVVLAHEFGSGVHGGGGPYRIDPRPGREYLSFDVGGRPVHVEFVVHPGVRGQGFMRRAIKDNSDAMITDAVDSAMKALERALGDR